MTSPILLDTCAAIWIAEDSRIEPAAEDALNDSGINGIGVFLSPVTAWEMGMLVSRKRQSLRMSVKAWFDTMLSRASLAELTPDLMIQSSFLPGVPPRDPFDRLFIATARANGYRIMTRDSKILDYAAQGHVHVIPC